MSSIFLDENVLGFAAGSQNNIQITSGKKTINGLLQDQLQFSVEADWDNIFSLSDRFNTAKSLLSTQNLGLFNAGIWTKKFYKGGSYLKINPKIRIVDWEANGAVLSSARALIDMCLPVFNGQLEKQVDAFINKEIASGEKFAGSKFTDKTKMVGNALVDGLEFIGEESANLFNGKDLQRIKNLLHGDEFLSNSPTPVHVNISNFYENYFIIDSVQVEFSKEMTITGPLYVDIQMSLSTPEVAVRGNSGLRTVVSKPRFIQVD